MPSIQEASRTQLWSCSPGRQVPKRTCQCPADLSSHLEEAGRALHNSVHRRTEGEPWYCLDLNGRTGTGLSAQFCLMTAWVPPSKGPGRFLLLQRLPGQGVPHLFPRLLPAVAFVTSFSLSGYPWSFFQRSCGREGSTPVGPDPSGNHLLSSSPFSSLPGRLDQRSRSSKKTNDGFEGWDTHGNGGEGLCIWMAGLFYF